MGLEVTDCLGTKHCFDGDVTFKIFGKVLVIYRQAPGRRRWYSFWRVTPYHEGGAVFCDFVSVERVNGILPSGDSFAKIGSQELADLKVELLSKDNEIKALRDIIEDKTREGWGN